MIGELCCFAPSLAAQTFDSNATNQPGKSWMSTTDFESNNPSPTRIIESHSQSGNRTVDERSFEILGFDGRFELCEDTQSETLRLDPATERTITRTFNRDGNGTKTITRLTEEEKRTLPGGDLKIVRITSSADLNGTLQPVQRVTVETKHKSADVVETNTTVMLPNINGGFAPYIKTHEIQKLAADATVESQETTLLPDGTGNWKASEIRHNIIKQEGADRNAEGHIFRRDGEGTLVEILHVVSRESETTSGRKLAVVETFSAYVPGRTQDGSLHLVERTTSSMRSSSTGERTTEQKVEQTNPGDPGSGLRVSVLVEGRMVPGPTGEQSRVTIRARDSNGNFGIVSVDTTKSDPIPTIEIQQTPVENPQ